MKPLHRILALGASALLVSGVAFPSAAADNKSFPGISSPAACSELGNHASVSKGQAVFMTGTYPKKWLDPGVRYKITKGSSTTVGRTSTGGASLEVYKVANLKYETSMSSNTTITATDSYSWKNESKTTKWLQLGARGYKFNWSSYSVVAPCKITNSKSGTATIPTFEEWFRHN